MRCDNETAISVVFSMIVVMSATMYSVGRKSADVLFFTITSATVDRF